MVCRSGVGVDQLSVREDSVWALACSCDAAFASRNWEGIAVEVLAPLSCFGSGRGKHTAQAV